MNHIIETYFLEPGSKLVNHTVGTNGVDCWFESPQWVAHRCLSFADFALIQPEL